MGMQPDLLQFLREKRIDPEKWMQGMPEAEKQLHFLSYTRLGRKAYEQRYLFYFNRWRHLYPLSEPTSGSDRSPESSS